jgi:hypothetical protein
LRDEKSKYSIPRICDNFVGYKVLWSGNGGWGEIYQGDRMDGFSLAWDRLDIG